MALSPVDRLRIILGVVKDGSGDRATLPTATRYIEAFWEVFPDRGNQAPTLDDKAEIMLRQIRQLVGSIRSEQRINVAVDATKQASRIAAEAEKLADLG